MNDLKDSVGETDKVMPWLPYLYVILLAGWAGIVRYLNKVKQQNLHLNVFLLFIEVTTSAFVGLCTYWLCLHFGVSETLTMFCVAISGHLGARAIHLFESFWQRLFQYWMRGVETKDKEEKRDD